MLNESQGANSCCDYELSFIKPSKDNKSWLFPHYYLEDYFIDAFDDLEIEYEIVLTNKGKFCKVKMDDIEWDHLYMLKVQAYSALIWYEPLQEYTFKSEFLQLTNTDNIQEILKDVKFPKFIKLDTVSAKDSGHSGIFNSAQEVTQVFKNSSRIQNTLFSPFDQEHHLFIREPNFDIMNKKGREYRCFIYQHKLTAVSCPKKDIDFLEEKEIELLEEQERIKKYFVEIIPKIPYLDACVDIFLNDNGSLQVIEINDFGADSPAGSGNYNWREDYMILYSDGETVDFRY